MVWCSRVEGTRGVCVCVVFVCLLSACSLFVGSLSLLCLCGCVVVCGGVVSVTLGASTRVSPDVARLKLGLPNRQTYKQTYIQTYIKLHVYIYKRSAMDRNTYIHFYTYISIYRYFHITKNPHTYQYKYTGT